MLKKVIFECDVTMIIVEDWTVQFSSVAQSCPALCDPMDCSIEDDRRL